MNLIQAHTRHIHKHAHVNGPERWLHYTLRRDIANEVVRVQINHSFRYASYRRRARTRWRVSRVCFFFCCCKLTHTLAPHMWRRPRLPLADRPHTHTQPGRTPVIYLNPLSQLNLYWYGDCECFWPIITFAGRWMFRWHELQTFCIRTCIIRISSMFDLNLRRSTRFFTSKLWTDTYVTPKTDDDERCAGWFRGTSSPRKQYSELHTYCTIVSYTCSIARELMYTHGISHNEYTINMFTSRYTRQCLIRPNIRNVQCIIIFNTGSVLAGERGGVSRLSHTHAHSEIIHPHYLAACMSVSMSVWMCALFIRPHLIIWKGILKPS